MGTGKQGKLDFEMGWTWGWLWWKQLLTQTRRLGRRVGRVLWFASGFWSAFSVFCSWWRSVGESADGSVLWPYSQPLRSQRKGQYRRNGDPC